LISEQQIGIQKGKTALYNPYLSMKLTTSIRGQRISHKFRW